VRHEFEEYLLVSAYMIVFIGAFTLYRHLILAEYGVYFSHGSPSSRDSSWERSSSSARRWA
jgi:hypothetical protein